MRRILVSDTSILVDLERGGLLEAVFRLPEVFAVPDLLFDRELADHNGAYFIALGLQVLELDADGVQLAVGYRLRQRKLSVPDTFALALAKRGGHVLLSGDGALRRLAGAVNVECHGVLWLFDLLEETQLLPLAVLAQRLTLIADHPRCRLPRLDILLRLARYRG